jgi:DNA (cytosine-5)-methyltransferase 1
VSFAYYNEIDPTAAEWLRWLIEQGLIANGWVDERSIVDVQPEDLEGYTQVHFFAGIGGWSLACRLGGWEDDRPIWTASCPCQPFSVAGKGAGTADERHLWPHVHRLLAARRPTVLVGEQVAGKAGYDWFDGIAADMAGEGYASRAVDIPACAVDAPHIRQRLYWCAVVNADGSDVGHSDGQRREEALREPRDSVTPPRERSTDCLERALGLGGLLEYPMRARRFGLSDLARASQTHYSTNPYSDVSYWSRDEWLVCHDGKARRTKPGLPLLAHGIPGRVAKWRGLGNAIVPPLAAEVIAALRETLD